MNLVDISESKNYYLFYVQKRLTYSIFFQFQFTWFSKLLIPLFPEERRLRIKK